MNKINYRGQESGVRSQVFIHHPSSLILKKLLLSITAAFCLMTGTAWATGEQVADYTAYPPFLPRVVSPNILFLLDYSKSMVRPAYGTCKTIADFSDAAVADSDASDQNISDCRKSFSHVTDDYSPTTAYYGYFDNGSSRSSACASSYTDSCAYKYSRSGTKFVKDETTPGPWNGNRLNWLTMTQFDILKKVVVGGDLNPAPEQGDPNELRSQLISMADTTPAGTENDYDGKFRKAVNLPGCSGAGCPSTNCSGQTPSSECATTGWPTTTYSWIATPGAGATTLFTTGDIDSSEVTLPFPFTFYGNTYTKLKVGIDGILSFTSLPTSESAPNYYDNGNIPVSNDQNNILVPYWDNLWIDNSKASTVKAFTTGSAPNRIFVVTYQDVSQYYDWSANAPNQALMIFQVLFYEGSNHIIFQYKDVDPDLTAASPSYNYVAGRSATIGAENSAGTGAKKYSYNGTVYDSTSVATALANCRADYTDAQHVGCAIFATPHITYVVEPTGTGTSDTIFYPAAPFASSYTVNINIPSGENQVSGNCPSAKPYYNKTKQQCYDHSTEGLLQDLRDGELGGTLGFRLGIQQLNATDGGAVTKHFNQKEGMGTGAGGWPSLMNDIRKQDPLTNTPLAEALYEAEGYFSETSAWDYGSDWTYDATSNACSGTNYDPYCFLSAQTRVSCCKSFVLLISAGNYSNDNQTSIYNETDTNGTIPAGAWRITPGETSGSEGTKANGGWLDGVGYKAHTTDWRSDLEGTQNLFLYTINTFGSVQTALSANISASDTSIPVTSTASFSSTGKIQIGDEVISYTGKTATSFTGCTRGADSTTAASQSSGWKVYQAPVLDGAKVLKRAAKYGGFDDRDGDGNYDSSDTDGDGVCDAGEREDDMGCDGDPDTYFEASGGGDLKAKILDAVTDILKSSASGTTVSVLSTSASGEGAIYQAYFYPAKIENVTEERTWPGYMRGFFLDKFQNLRDDSSGGAAPDAKLVMKNSDRIARMSLNTTTNAVDVNLFTDTDGDGTSDGSAGTTNMDNVITIWEAGKKLALRDKSTRSIYTWADTDGDGVVDNGDFSILTGEALTFVNTPANRVTFKPYLRAADDTEAGNIIDFIRGTHVSGYRNRCISVGGTGDGCSTGRSWALGDIVYSTPTLVSGPGEKFDEIYGDSTYRSFRTTYANRRSVIYAGGNDGMLHAFNGGVYKIGDDTVGTPSVVESGRFIANSSSDVNGFANGWSSPIELGLGDELWAFVPHDNLPHLAWLACNGTATDPSVCSDAEYTHVYYVDQRPKVTDVRIFSADTDHPGGWGTVLIMGMRFGGGAIDVTADFDYNAGTADTTRQFRSAFYAFDITNPEKPPKLLWRFYDSGLGFTTSYPAIARVCSDPTTSETCRNTEKWYMVVGSGPKNATGANNRDYGGSSTTQVAPEGGKIYVVDLADGSLDKTFTVDSNTFMGDPTVVDADINFTSDVIYIGSAIGGNVSPPTPAEYMMTSGKVYRINTNGTIPSTTGTNWTRSTLFDPDTTQTSANPDDSTGTSPNIKPKDMGPLLVGPSVSKDSQGNLWVFFGTGRLRSTTDLSNSHQQRFYAIKDGCWKGTGESTCTTGTSGAPGYTYEIDDLMNTSNLTVCTSAAGGKIIDPTAGQTCESASPAYSSYNSLVTDVRNYKGWYLNLGNTANPSERVLSRSVVLGGLVLFTAYTPTSDMCSIFGDSAIYALYYETGTAYIKPTLPAGTAAEQAAVAAGTVLKSISLGKGMPTAVGVAIGETVSGFVQKSTGEIVRIEAQPGLGVRSGAASWREKTGGGGTSEIETIYKHIVK